MATKRELEERIRQQEEQISELFHIIDELKAANLEIQQRPQDSGGVEKTKRGRPPIDEETKLRVRALRQDGYSMGDIARIVGISKGVVHKILQSP